MTRDRPGPWGSLELFSGDSARRIYGPIELVLHRRRGEWWVATEPAQAERPPDWRIGEADQVAPPDPDRCDHLSRHLFTDCPDRAIVRPALADRPVIARPRMEISIQPRQSASVFAATPLWIEVVVAGSTLIEEPLARPSDTWFGSSPTVGELCYAVKTSARLDLAHVETRDDLAITEVRIENEGEEPLSLSYLRIPAPNLSIYLDREGWLKTETITLRRTEEDEMATLDIVPGRPPGVAQTSERLREPRQPVPARTVIRAFQRNALATLFGT